ncbi:MAG: dihydrolipoamide acetyltransferase family protein [Polyangiales bacterium]|nr:2-oxo acid dehydrogenase subunit E2 [Myxococcales bacterium]
MADFEFKLPDIGEGVTEGEITDWLVKTGDAVNEDDPMVEVMTDKATVTIGAPRKGVIQDIRFQVGEVAKVGQVLVVIGGQGGATVVSAPAAASTSSPSTSPSTSSAAEPAPSKPASSDGPAATAVGDIRDGLPGSNYFQTKPAKSSGSNGNGQTKTAADYWNPKPLATPAIRKLARDLSIDLRRVRPTHPSGRVTKEDVRGFGAGASYGAAPSRSAMQEEPVHHVPAELKHSTPRTEVVIAEPIEPNAVQDTVVGLRAPERSNASLEVRKPFVGIRRRIAERMQLSKNTAAHFTFVEECNADALMALRKRLQPKADAAGLKLTFLPFIVKAVVAALKKHPVLNSALDPQTNELVYRGYYHVGVAAATPQGLMVPVVRDADRKSIIEIGKDIERLGEGARTGSLASNELTGSTFTITSLGKQGGLFATPVLNYPEVGILGVHQIKERPVVRNGEIVIGNVMLLSLSFDHRIVDGHVGAAFAYDIIAFLEDPEQLFLEMS